MPVRVFFHECIDRVSMRSCQCFRILPRVHLAYENIIVPCKLTVQVLQNCICRVESLAPISDLSSQVFGQDVGVHGVQDVVGDHVPESPPQMLPFTQVCRELLAGGTGLKGHEPVCASELDLLSTALTGHEELAPQLYAIPLLTCHHLQAVRVERVFHVRPQESPELVRDSHSIQPHTADEHMGGAIV